MKTIKITDNFTLVDVTNNQTICACTLPCSDFGAMVKKGIISNPLNSSSDEEFNKITEPVYTHDHAFRGVFSIDSDILQYNNIHLYIDKIDTLCKIIINDELVYSSDNSYIPVDTDIKKYIHEGENSIEFKISSPVNYIISKQKEKPLPKNANGIDGAAYIRKPSCHFGWDWGPCVPYKYVGNVTIQAYNSKIILHSIDQKFDDAACTVTIDAENYIKAHLVSPDGKIIEFSDNTAVVNDPQLWYPRDLLGGNNPVLYTLHLENDEYSISRKIGLRQVELDRNSDEYGTNFKIKVNGKNVFAKGANVIPYSAIPDLFSRKQVDHLIQTMLDANFNIVRLWGGGEYGDEYFLEKCDELGIMVWQDFMFACMLYPLYDEEFKNNCIKEAEINVLRENLHPCVCLWCGNNEIESMFSWYPKTSKLIQSYTTYFWGELDELMHNISSVPYIPTSPLGDKPFSKNTADEVGDTHMWNVWHGMKNLDYYRLRYTRFLSEFGLESLPSKTAIKTFAAKIDLESSAFMSHQKCIGGNAKMLWYLKERFDMPLVADYLPYMTGIVQGECVRNATEHFRINKGRCNGSIFWQLNDVWNCPSWSSVDYEGLPKALMYMAKHFFAPVSVSYENGVFYAHNDTLNPVSVKYLIETDDSSELDYIDIPADSVVPIKCDKLKKNSFMRISLGDATRTIDNIKKLEPAHFTVEKGKDYLIISSDVYCRSVFIESDTIFSDNYFSLLPGEKKTIKFDGNLHSYNILCENNIISSENKLQKKISRLMFAVKTENIANFVYYSTN